MIKKVFYFGLGVVGLIYDKVTAVTEAAEEKVAAQRSEKSVAPATATAELVAVPNGTRELVATEAVATQIVAKPATALQTNGKSQKLPTKVKEDDLTQIKGIGPTFARRLKEAGITTFAQLAGATVGQLQEITGVAEWQADPADWIAQARTLA